MPCLFRYRWLKLPRAALPQGKGLSAYWPGLPRGLPFARALPPIAGTKTLLSRACGPAVWSV